MPGELMESIRKKELLLQIKQKEQLFNTKKEKELVAPLSSFGTGVASGMTFGTTPLAAGVGAGAGTLYSNIIEQDLPIKESLGNAWDAFKEGRRERNEFEQSQQQANPTAYMLGNIGGGIATSRLIPVKAFAPNAKYLDKVIQSGKTGAKAGVGYGVLSSAASAEDAQDVATRVGSGAVIGGGLGALATGAIEGGKAGYKGLKSLINRYKASKAASAGEPITGTGILKPQTGKDIQQVLKEDIANVAPTRQTIEKNLEYEKMGLEPLSPIQLQPKAYGEPTPAQYAETILKSRDPELYTRQLKQVEKYENILDKYRKLGAPSKESAGAQIKEKLIQGKQVAGKTIGEFKDSIASTKVTKESLPKIAKEYSQIPYSDPLTGKTTTLNKKLGSIKTIKELDDLASDLGTAKSQLYVANGSQASRGTHALGEVKDQLEKFIEKKIPEGKPREIYQQYAKAKQLFNDTLRGTFKTGGSEKVLDKITSTAENFEQFKEVAIKFGKPELVDMVKDNYLSNIFNSKNWKLAWEKEAKTEVVKRILPEETIQNIGKLLKYDAQMRSTMTSTVNPPRSGIVSSVTEMSKRPVKQVVMELVFGKERQMKNAIAQYKKLTSQPVGAQVSVDPLRKTRGVLGRELFREYNDKE